MADGAAAAAAAAGAAGAVECARPRVTPGFGAAVSLAATDALVAPPLLAARHHGARGAAGGDRGASRPRGGDEVAHERPRDDELEAEREQRDRRLATEARLRRRRRRRRGGRGIRFVAGAASATARVADAAARASTAAVEAAAVARRPPTASARGPGNARRCGCNRHLAASMAPWRGQRVDSTPDERGGGRRPRRLPLWTAPLRERTSHRRAAVAARWPERRHRRRLGHVERELQQ